MVITENLFFETKKLPKNTDDLEEEEKRKNEDEQPQHALRLLEAPTPAYFFHSQFAEKCVICYRIRLGLSLGLLDHVFFSLVAQHCFSFVEQVAASVFWITFLRPRNRSYLPQNDK